MFILLHLKCDGGSGVFDMILAENNPKQKEKCIVKSAEDEQ